MLLSSSELIKWGAVQDYANSTLVVDNEVIKLNKMDSGHYGIDLGRTEEVMDCYTIDEVFDDAVAMSFNFRCDPLFAPVGF